jgi:hypothetical protein
MTPEEVAELLVKDGDDMHHRKLRTFNEPIAWKIILRMQGQGSCLEWDLTPAGLISITGYSSI